MLAKKNKTFNQPHIKEDILSFIKRIYEQPRASTLLSSNKDIIAYSKGKKMRQSVLSPLAKLMLKCKLHYRKKFLQKCILSTYNNPKHITGA
jgi:hypothetical protein